MLDGLLGRGFSSKCKSWIKMTKTRLEVIVRRRNAMQKYLKKDIADLLANGLDTNAYSRAEGLLIELNLSFCYDFVAQICGTIPKHLSVMQKQRECPDDCRETISSLIFAAARFADLPELRHLRDIFTERYGTLEPFVNKEFVEKLSAKPPASEKKLQLMREIAKEFSINWDSKAMEQSIANSHLYAQNAVKIEDIKLHNSLDGITPKRDNQEVPSTGRQGLPPDGYILHEKRGGTTLDRNKPNVNGRQGYSDDKYRLHSEGRETISEKVNQDVLLPRRREVGDDQYIQHNSSTETVLERGNKYDDDGFKPHQTRARTTWKKVNLDALSQKDYTGNAMKTDKDSNDTILKRVNLDNSYNERRKNDNGLELLNQREDTARQQDKQEIRSYGVQNHPTSKPKTKIDDKEEIPFAGGNHKAPYNSSVVTEEASRGAKSVKPLPPPPYVKPNGGKYTGSYASSDQANKAGMEVLVNDRSVNSQTGLDHVGNSESKKAVGPVCGDEDVDRRDDNVGERKPQSVRRRHLKPPAVKDHRGTDEGEEVARRDLNGRREVVWQGGTNEGDEVVRRDPNRRREVVRQGGSNEGDEVVRRDPNRREVVRQGGSNEGDEVVRRDPNRRREVVRQGGSNEGDDVVRRDPNRRREVVRQGGSTEGDEVLRRDPNRRREVARQGLQLALDNDHRSPDEEKIMDNLLIHYSKKPSKFGPPIKIGRSSNHPLGDHVGVDDNAPQMKRRNGVVHLDPEPVSPPPRAVSRAVSLPPEPAIPDTGRAPTRATSFQPEMMNPGRHVHPRLPEYDDLAARIASLRSG